jgi:anaphase-promoting complex subunit 6
MDIEATRQHAERLLENHAYESCVFIASRLVTLSNKNASDIFLLARCLYSMQQPLKAIHVLESTGLLKNDQDPNYLRYVLLAAQSLRGAGKPEDVLRTTETVTVQDTIDASEAKARALRKWGEDLLPILSLICLERGKAFEAMDNHRKAISWMKIALHIDVRCYEALDRIVNSQLTSEDEVSLIDSLRRARCFSSTATTWMEPIVRCLVGRFDCSSPSDGRFQDAESIRALTDGPSLADDSFVLAVKADARLHQRDAKGAYDLTTRIFANDPTGFDRAALSHIAALVELGKTSELFHFAHVYVKQYPRKALSWYAVGAYYFSAKRFDMSRRYFSKATSWDSTLLAAWIGSAHAHAMHDESDRAMAIYRTAARLFPGSHVPVLGTAVEYLRTNNITLAEQFCRQALQLCEVDPAVYNELGVVLYKKRKFGEAAECFRQAIIRCAGVSQRVFSLAFEHLYFNLGHALRRSGNLTDATEAYELGLQNSPKSASGHAALGLTHHLLGQVLIAIEQYHIALGLRPGDSIVEELMDLATKDLVRLS